MPNTTQRLFFGVPVATEARRGIEASLAAWPGHGQMPGRQVAPRNWHVTLVFLGMTTPDIRDALIAKVQSSGPICPAFTLTTGPLGGFGRAGRSRILYLDFTAGVEALARLQSRVAALVSEVGVPLELGPYTPHLTLARLKPPADLRPLLALPPPRPVRLPVERYALFLSRAGDNGSEYEELHSFALASAP